MMHLEQKALVLALEHRRNPFESTFPLEVAVSVSNCVSENQNFDQSSKMPVVAAPPAGGPVGPSTFDKSMLSAKSMPAAQLGTREIRYADNGAVKMGAMMGSST